MYVYVHVFSKSGHYTFDTKACNTIDVLYTVPSMIAYRH